MSFLSFLRPKKRPVHFNRLKLPIAWMPKANMRRIHLHWTAGSHIASSLDKEHYHFLIELRNGKPQVVRGQPSISDNEPPLVTGRYAAHTRKANSRAIGIAICGMDGASDNPLKPGDYPIKESQWNTTVALIATLARHYGIAVTEKTILTHAEIQPNLGIVQRGKWDIAWLPFWKKTLSASAVGDKLRNEVAQLV